MTQRRFLLAFALIASSAFAMGCHREHLSSQYGQAYSAWFAAQHVNRPPSEQARRILEGLDAQEAALVSKSYRRTTGRGEEGEGGGRMLMIGPNRGGGPEAYIPPPSVPGGQ
jgi:hypothetical protein